MKYLVLGAVLCLLAVQSQADELKSGRDPELFTKTYSGMHSLERPFDLGKSTLTLSVGCQASAKKAEEALERKTGELAEKVKAAAAELGLKEGAPNYKMELTGTLTPSRVKPLSREVDAETNRYVWKNVCTGERFEKPVRLDWVYGAEKSISISFPNQGEVLNSLTTLVTRLEESTEKATDGVKVTCAKQANGNFVLLVSDAVEKSTWEEIKKESLVRARAKAKLDLPQYDTYWEGVEVFQPYATQVPYAQVVEENGEWIAKIERNQVYTVYVKQRSGQDSKKPALLGDFKRYPIKVTATTKEGLFGTLQITVEKSCFLNKGDAEKAVAEVGNPILAKLRELNQERNTETDRLNVKDAAGVEDDPLVEYAAVDQEGKRITNYYNGCTLETYEGPERPTVRVWKATQYLEIRASDLKALAKLRGELVQEHPQVAEREVTELNVSVSDVAGQVRLAKLEEIGAQLEVASMEKFLSKEEKFKCEAGNFEFACLSDGQAYVEAGAAEFAPLNMASDKKSLGGALYSSQANSNIAASERGMKEFTGHYTLYYKVRKVLHGK